MSTRAMVTNRVATMRFRVVLCAQGAVLLGVMFADGWDVCPAFEAFSKPDIINLLEAAIDFVGPVSPYVPPRFLRLEADRRGVVVDFFILACYTFS